MSSGSTPRPPRSWPASRGATSDPRAVNDADDPPWSQGGSSGARSPEHVASARPSAIHLVQEQAPGHGEVQGVGHADHRDPDEVPAELALQRREALALLAEHEHRRAGIVEAMELGRSVGRGADGPATMAAQPVPEAALAGADDPLRK